MNLAAIRRGLAGLIDNVPGLRTEEYVRDNLNPPVAVVGLGDGDYDDDFNGDTTVNLSVLLLASRASDAATGQKVIDEFLDSTGSKSLRAAVNTDPTLGGTVDSAKVVRWSDYGVHPVGDVQYVGVIVQVEVFC